MKIIKYSLFIGSFLLLYVVTKAQTNTFPSSGNVGIGTASPSNPLDIQAFNSSLYSSTTAPATFLRLFNRNTGATGLTAAINFITRANDQTGQGFNIGVVSSDGGYSPNLIFQSQTGSSTYIERMRIDANGNVGIGVMPKTWHPTYNGALQIGIGASVFGRTDDAGTAMIGANYYINSAGVDKYIGTNYASNIYLNTGKIQFRVAPLGTTDNTISWINAVTIDNSGNLGVGTVTPSEKLSVNGNIRAQKLIVTQTGWSDYVFEPSYKLRKLSELEAFIKTNKHLPETPSAKEVSENGISVGDNQALLLKKIEELTLYVMELNKHDQKLQNEVLKQARKIQQLENKINKQ